MASNNSHIFLLIFGLFIGVSAIRAQQPDVPMPSPVIEELLENITEANEDVMIEDDAYLQQMTHFIKDPLNLNFADEGMLQELRILSPIQIANLLRYRNVFGMFINIYELQAIPGWDPALIRRLRPYITVDAKDDNTHTLISRLKNGDQSLLLRFAQTFERSEGYLRDSGTRYPGSPHRVLLRYKYQFKNQLQYGFTAEKDPGEQFFKGAQKAGFDFYSAHFFARDLGIIKSLAIGDFAVNLGQGLTQWQSLSFGKGADIMNMKRQADVLRPYNSAGEVAFNRGIGITLKKQRWQTTLFASYRKLDGNVEAGDTLNADEVISSLQLSGLHRTSNEIADRKVQGQFSAGGNVAYQHTHFHLGINAVHHSFEKTIQKKPLLYNQYALQGRTSGNYSVDYSMTFKNLHFFGEAAVDEKMHGAFVNGVAISVHSAADVSFLHRKISSRYQALYASAFTENTNPNNESGFYTGINLRPTDHIRIDAYADFFRFPWLKFRTDAPSYGQEYMVQFTYTPNKEVLFYTRYRAQKKEINFNPESDELNPVIGRPKQSLRAQFNIKLDSRFMLRTRVENAWFDKQSAFHENGFISYADIVYKPLLKPLSGNVRLCYFETDGYNSRMYAFENDVLYSYSIPVFSGKGFRYYLNVNYDIRKNISVWMRIAQTVYHSQTSIGSGLDEIEGNMKTEIKLQARFLF